MLNDNNNKKTPLSRRDAIFIYSLVGVGTQVT